MKVLFEILYGLRGEGEVYPAPTAYYKDIHAASRYI